MQTDLTSTFYGSVIAIGGHTRRGRAWLRSHVEGARNCCDMVNAEHRYGVEILQGALAAGLTIRDTATGRTAGNRER